MAFRRKLGVKKLKNSVLVDVLLSVNWLPLGGFVKLQGEHDCSRQKRRLWRRDILAKTKSCWPVWLINWIVAAVLLTFLPGRASENITKPIYRFRRDTTISRQPVEIVSVTKDSPAASADLKIGDQILRFAGEPVNSSQALGDQTKAKKGEKVEIIYSRGGVESTVQVTLRDKNANGQGYLGVGSSQREEIQASWSAPIVGVVTTGQFTIVTLQGLGDMVVNLAKGVFLQFSPDQSTRAQAHQDLQTVSNSVAGPIGILGTIFPAAEQAGLTQLIFLTAIISLTLAVMNVLPIPALDGGRWFTMVIFRLLKKPLTKEREEKIQGTGFMILMLLIIVITVADVTKLFR